MPVSITPAAGAQLTTDTPTFTVQNARGYNTPSTMYTFQVLKRSGAGEIASITVNAGRGTTSATFTFRTTYATPVAKHPLTFTASCPSVNSSASFA